MLIHSASQLLTLAGGPQRGRELGRLAIIPDGAVLSMLMLLTVALLVLPARSIKL